MSDLAADAVVERVGRRLAARHTRRTFLDRMAKVAVLVAGGPTLATFLTERAEARVCGQSGVSPKCPTFDCTGPGDVWGWCWYASPGCCAGGGLKKICDCCRVNHPNVHGYCPSGTNVRCIVESCAADPRVMPVAVGRVAGSSSAAVALTHSRRYPPDGRRPAVVGDGEDALSAALASPVAAALGAPLLLTGRPALDGPVSDELRRLGPSEVIVVGPGLSGRVDTDIAALGLRVSRPHDYGDLGPASVQVARFLQLRAGATRGFCVERGGVSAAAAPAVAAVAAARRAPVLLGVDAAIAAATGEGALAVTYLCGPEAAGRSHQVAGGFAVPGGGRVNDVALAVARLAVATERLRDLSVHLVPEGGRAMGSGVGAGLVLFHPDGALGADNAAFLRSARGSVGRAFDTGLIGALGSGGTYDAQSVLNGFDTDRLQGGSGQGLPVRSQPLEERPLGRARVKGALPPEEPTSYWSGRANPNR